MAVHFFKQDVLALDRVKTVSAVGGGWFAGPLDADVADGDVAGAENFHGVAGSVFDGEAFERKVVAGRFDPLAAGGLAFEGEDRLLRTAAADGDVFGGDVELALEFVAARFELDDVAGDGVDDAGLEFELDVLTRGDGVGLRGERGVTIAASGRCGLDRGLGLTTTCQA